MKLLIDIPEVVKHKVYAYGLSLSPSDKEQLIKAILNGTPIPDNATNGDVIMAIFEPNRITRVDDDTVNIDYDITPKWWNAPYQKGDKE